MLRKNQNTVLYSIFTVIMLHRRYTPQSVTPSSFCVVLLLFTHYLVLDVTPLLFVKRRRLRPLLFWAVSLRIQSECGKIWTRITPNTDSFYAVNTTRINSLKFCVRKKKIHNLLK